MSKFAEVVAAVLAALGRLVGKSVSVFKMVGGKLVRTTETVMERVFDVAGATSHAGAGLLDATNKLVIGAASDVIKAPFRLAGLAARAVLGNRAPEQAPDQAATQAEKAAEAQVARSDVADDARQVLSSLRRVAQARAIGQVPDLAHTGRLPAKLLEYVESLSRDECDALARRPTSDLRAIISGRLQRGDVRSPDQVAADRAPAPVVDIEAEHKARKAYLHAALRAPRQPTADDVLAMAGRRA